MTDEIALMKQLAEAIGDRLDDEAIECQIKTDHELQDDGVCWCGMFYGDFDEDES